MRCGGGYCSQEGELTGLGQSGRGAAPCGGPCINLGWMFCMGQGATIGKKEMAPDGHKRARTPRFCP